MTSDPIESLHKQVLQSKLDAVAKSSQTPNEIPSDKYIFCNTCKGETNHICKADYSRQYVTEAERFLGGFWQEVGYRLWMCAGCESCTLERYYTDETMEDGTGDFGEQYYDVEYYPERTEFHVESKRFLQLPEKLDALYRETLHAFNHNMPVLCSAGVRTLIEGICEDKHIKGKNLEEKINGLSAVLPQNIVANLHRFRFIGNTALHELVTPDRDDLRLAIEICEDLLNFLYELDYKTSRLAGSNQGNEPIP